MNEKSGKSEEKPGKETKNLINQEDFHFQNDATLLHESSLSRQNALGESKTERKHKDGYETAERSKNFSQIETEALKMQQQAHKSTRNLDERLSLPRDSQKMTGISIHIRQNVGSNEHSSCASSQKNLQSSQSKEQRRRSSNNVFLRHNNFRHDFSKPVLKHSHIQMPQLYNTNCNNSQATNNMVSPMVINNTSSRQSLVSNNQRSSQKEIGTSPVYRSHAAVKLNKWNKAQTDCDDKFVEMGLQDVDSQDLIVNDKDAANNNLRQEQPKSVNLCECSEETVGFSSKDLHQQHAAHMKKVSNIQPSYQSGSCSVGQSKTQMKQSNKSSRLVLNNNATVVIANQESNNDTVKQQSISGNTDAENKEKNQYQSQRSNQMKSSQKSKRELSMSIKSNESDDNTDSQASEPRMIFCSEKGSTIQPEIISSEANITYHQNQTNIQITKNNHDFTDDANIMKKTSAALIVNQETTATKTGQSTKGGIVDMMTATTTVTSPHTVTSSLPYTIHGQHHSQQTKETFEIVEGSQNDAKILEHAQVSDSKAAHQTDSQNRNNIAKQVTSGELQQTQSSVEHEQLESSIERDEVSVMKAAIDQEIIEDGNVMMQEWPNQVVLSKIQGQNPAFYQHSQQQQSRMRVHNLKFVPNNQIDQDFNESPQIINKKSQRGQGGVINKDLASCLSFDKNDIKNLKQSQNSPTWSKKSRKMSRNVIKQRSTKTRVVMPSHLSPSLSSGRFRSSVLASKNDQQSTRMTTALTRHQNHYQQFRNHQHRHKSNSNINDINHLMGPFLKTASNPAVAQFIAQKIDSKGGLSPIRLREGGKAVTTTVCQVHGKIFHLQHRSQVSLMNNKNGFDKMQPIQLENKDSIKTLKISKMTQIEEAHKRKRSDLVEDILSKHSSIDKNEEVDVKNEELECIEGHCSISEDSEHQHFAHQERQLVASKNVLASSLQLAQSGQGILKPSASSVNGITRLTTTLQSSIGGNEQKQFMTTDLVQQLKPRMMASEAQMKTLQAKAGVEQQQSLQYEQHSVMQTAQDKVPIYKSKLFSPVMKLELTKVVKNVGSASKDQATYYSTQPRQNEKRSKAQQQLSQRNYMSRPLTDNLNSLRTSARNSRCNSRIATSTQQQQTSTHIAGRYNLQQKTRRSQHFVQSSIQEVFRKRISRANLSKNTFSRENFFAKCSSQEGLALENPAFQKNQAMFSRTATGRRFTTVASQKSLNSVAAIDQDQDVDQQSNLKQTKAYNRIMKQRKLYIDKSKLNQNQFQTKQNYKKPQQNNLLSDSVLPQSQKMNLLDRHQNQTQNLKFTEMQKIEVMQTAGRIRCESSDAETDFRSKQSPMPPKKLPIPQVVDFFDSERVSQDNKTAQCWVKTAKIARFPSKTQNVKFLSKLVVKKPSIEPTNQPQKDNDLEQLSTERIRDSQKAASGSNFHKGDYEQLTQQSKRPSMANIDRAKRLIITNSHSKKLEMKNDVEPIHEMAQNRRQKMDANQKQIDQEVQQTLSEKVSAQISSAVSLRKKKTKRAFSKKIKKEKEFDDEMEVLQEYFNYMDDKYSSKTRDRWIQQPLDSKREAAKESIYQSFVKRIQLGGSIVKKAHSTERVSGIDNLKNLDDQNDQSLILDLIKYAKLKRRIDKQELDWQERAGQDIKFDHFRFQPASKLDTLDNKATIQKNKRKGQ